MADAARASVSDMFYFPCHRSPHGDFLGGVTDLFPMEIANALAAEVWMEKKRNTTGLKACLRYAVCSALTEITGCAK
jgi:hypothetical protein